MKVAIVLNTSWNIYNFRLHLVRALLAKGYQVHAIAPYDDFSNLLTQEGCVYHKIKMDSRGANPIKDFALIFELYFIYRKIKPDVILHYTIKPNIYGTIAAHLLKIPSVNNVCGLGTIFLKKNYVSAIAINLYKVAFRFPEKVFFQNPDDLSFFINNKLVKKERADLLPGSGIDLTRFTPSPHTRNNPFVFLLISRLISDKGIFEFIEAVKILKKEGLQARFQILGAKDPFHKRGIPVSVIDEWVSHNLIDYLGTTQDVRTYIQQADCIVLPSYREGTPRTLLEAASCGKPIIATDVPGCHHTVTHLYNGLLCKMKDSHDLAKRMAQMAQFQDTELQKMGENGRKKMEAEYDENIITQKYLYCLQTIRPF